VSEDSASEKGARTVAPTHLEGAVLFCHDMHPNAAAEMGAPPLTAPPPSPPRPSQSPPAPIAPDFEGAAHEPRPIWPWILVGVVIVVSIVVLALVLSGGGRSQVTATYTELGFEWDMPQSTFCNDVGFSTPGVPFTVNASETFNVSWYITCTSGGPSTIHSVGLIDETIVVGSSSGTLDSSNVPVSVSAGNYTYFNITCTAPGHSYDGPLLFMITASSP
jgi:hypothetical protein